MCVGGGASFINLGSSLWMDPIMEAEFKAGGSLQTFSNKLLSYFRIRRQTLSNNVSSSEEFSDQ